MRVPTYERQVGMRDVPDVHISNTVTQESMGAGIGQAIEKAGMKLAYVAAKQQEEVDRAEFALLDAKADAYADELFMSESQNPDYEGTINRYKEGWRKYAEETAGSVPDRLREKAGRLLEMKGMAYEGKFKGLFLKKQTDHLKRTLDDTVTVLVKNHDEQGLVRAIEGSTVLSEEQKGDMIRKGRRLIQVDEIKGRLRENPYREDINWTEFDALMEGDKESLDDFRNAEVGERERALRKVSVQNKNAMIAQYYESGGAFLWGAKDLDALRGAGKIDDDTYSDLMVFSINVQEARAREAQAAAREARAGQRAMLELMTPEEKEFFRLQRMGTTLEMNKKEVGRLNGLLAKGSLSANDLVESRAKGLITPSQEKEFRNLKGEHDKIEDSFYKKGVSDNRGLLEKTLNPLVNGGYISMDDYNDTLARFDAVTIGKVVPREQVDDLVRGLMRGVKVNWGVNSFMGIPMPETGTVGEVKDMLKEWSKIPLGADVEALFGKPGAPEKKETKPAKASTTPPPKNDPNRKKWIQDQL